MRALVSGILVIAAVLLAALAIPAAWADRNLRSADGFVELTAPFGADPAFQDALARALATETAAAAQLPEAVAELARPLLEESARELRNLPAYPRAFNDTLRRSHELTLGSAGTSPDGSIRLDVAPLAALLVDSLSERLGVEVPAPAGTVITLPESGLLPPGLQQQLLSMVPMTAGWPWLAAGSLLAALLAVAAARSKGNALIALGIGLGLAAAAHWLTLQSVTGWAERAGGAEVAGLFTRAFVAGAAEGFQPWIWATAGLGVVLMIMGALARSVRQRR